MNKYFAIIFLLLLIKLFTYSYCKKEKNENLALLGLFSHDLLNLDSLCSKELAKLKDGSKKKSSYGDGLNMLHSIISNQSFQHIDSLILKIETSGLLNLFEFPKMNYERFSYQNNSIQLASFKLNIYRLINSHLQSVRSSRKSPNEKGRIHVESVVRNNDTIKVIAYPIIEYRVPEELVAYRNDTLISTNSIFVPNAVYKLCLKSKTEEECIKYPL